MDGKHPPPGCYKDPAGGAGSKDEQRTNKGRRHTACAFFMPGFYVKVRKDFYIDRIDRKCA